jgi:hypothetical protein
MSAARAAAGRPYKSIANVIMVTVQTLGFDI